MFSYEFWLKCFQLKNCNPFWELSNVKLQPYIKTNMRWLWLENNSKHDCFNENLDFSSTKVYCSLGKLPFWLRDLGLSLGKVHCFVVKVFSLKNLGLSSRKFIAPWRTFLFFCASCFLKYFIWILIKKFAPSFYSMGTYIVS